MIRINLLPVRAAQKKEKLISQIVVLSVTLVATALICGGLQAMLSSKIAERREQIQEADREIASLNKKIGEVDKIKKLTADLENKRKVLASLEAARSGPVRLLDELSRAIPEKVWIDSFQVSGGNVSISGSGLTEEDVAVFLKALDDSDYYQGVNLEVIQDSKEGNTFKLQCRVQNPPKKQS